MEQALYGSHDIVAIQEPCRPGHMPMCPRDCNYWLIYGGGRAALYVHKRWPISDWEATESKDFCRVSFAAVTVTSVYSPDP